MEILRDISLVLHFIGLAALLGGVIVQVKPLRQGRAVINKAILHGAILQLVSGLALTGIAEATSDPNHLKITVKTAILLTAGVLAIAFRKREVAPSWAVGAIGGLTVANIAIAVAW